MKKKGLSMSNIDEREKFDGYELKDDYDFSGGARGRFYKPKKVPNQSLINALVRKEVQSV